LPKKEKEKRKVKKMRRVIFRDWYTNKVVQKKKLNAKAQNASVSYQFEGSEFVIRSYYTGEVLQRFVPKFGGSCSFTVEDDE